MGNMTRCYYGTAFTLSIFSFIACLISFVTPFWLVSWEQKHSTFTRIGLWEVCFTAFTDPKMFAYKYYNGCWWIFHSEVDAIRDMLNPAWFKSVQAFSVITLLACTLALLMFVIGWCSKGKKDNSMVAATVFSFITVFGGILCIIIFGACAKDPRLYRLPMPQYNYFSFGFAMMILATLSSGFCCAFSIGAIKEEKEDEYKD